MNILWKKSDCGRHVQITRALDKDGFNIFLPDIRDCFGVYFEEFPELMSSSIYGAGYNFSSCPHTEVPLEEFVQIGIENFGGSFQNLAERLTRKGYVLCKKA
jgi:hypothetical protein